MLVSAPMCKDSGCLLSIPGSAQLILQPSLPCWLTQHLGDGVPQRDPMIFLLLLCHALLVPFFSLHLTRSPLIMLTPRRGGLGKTIPACGTDRKSRHLHSDTFPSPGSSFGAADGCAGSRFAKLMLKFLQLWKEKDRPTGRMMKGSI